MEAWVSENWTVASCMSTEKGYLLHKLCLGSWPAKLNSGLGKEQMKTRSSSSAALVPFVKSPAGQSREALLQIVDPTSSSRKLLPGWTIVKRPRSSSTSRKGSVDTVSESWPMLIVLCMIGIKLMIFIVSHSPCLLHLRVLWFVFFYIWFLGSKYLTICIKDRS